MAAAGKASGTIYVVSLLVLGVPASTSSLLNHDIHHNASRTTAHTQAYDPQITSGLTVTSSLELTYGGSWPASNAIFDGTTCPFWPTVGSVAIAGTSNQGNGQQWFQVNLGTTYSVSTVKYYYKAILSGSYGGNIASVSTCAGDNAAGCTVCSNSGSDVDGDFYNCSGAQGQYVRITRSPDLADNWHWCRMKVFGQTSTTTTEASPSSGTGDPHLKNMFGERFDLMRPGKFVLINIPRGKLIEDALLLVEADARRMGGGCMDMYFKTLNITGAWVDKAQTGGLRFDADGASDEKPKWFKFGPVELKVVHGRTLQGTLYLNFYVKHLGHTRFPVGGLLGEDDHTQEAMPTEQCLKTMSLMEGGSFVQSAPTSVALASAA